MRGAVSIALAFKQVCDYSFLFNKKLKIIKFHKNCLINLFVLRPSYDYTSIWMLLTYEVHKFWRNLGSGQRYDDHKHHNCCPFQYSGMFLII